MYNDQRRGDSWKLNDLRALLFGHYAWESMATSSPLAVEGFSRESVKVPSVRQMPPQLVPRIMSMWFRYQPFACYKTKGLY